MPHTPEQPLPTDATAQPPMTPATDPVVPAAPDALAAPVADLVAESSAVPAADPVADPVIEQGAAAASPDAPAASADPAPDGAPVPATKPAELDPAACAALLKKSFPALFSGTPKPIKLRVQADIQTRMPGIFTKAALSGFLRRHTGSTSYLIALTRAKSRFDLDGQPDGELSAEHRDAAVQELERRRSVQHERRAQEDAARQQRAFLLRAFETTTLTPANFCALKGIAPVELDALLEQARRERAEAPPPPLREDHRPDFAARDRRPDRGPRGPQGAQGAQGPGEPGDRRGPRHPNERRGPRGAGAPQGAAGSGHASTNNPGNNAGTPPRAERREPRRDGDRPPQGPRGPRPPRG